MTATSNGTFVVSIQSVGNSDSKDIALGDLDGDGDLDTFIAIDVGPNKASLNQ